MKRLVPVIVVAGLIAFALYLTLSATSDELSGLDNNVVQASGHLDRAVSLSGVAATQIIISYLEHLREENQLARDLKDAVAGFNLAKGLRARYWAVQELAPKIEQALQEVDKKLKLEELWFKNAKLLMIARNYYNAQVVQYSLALSRPTARLLSLFTGLPQHSTIGEQTPAAATHPVPK